LRTETEWVETVDTGWNVLVDADKDAIVERYTSFHPTGARPQVYGDGEASIQIVHQLDILIKK
jgi:UDP-N-acetylglucosamine 2-epimerase